MPVWLEVVLGVLCIVLICNNLSLRSRLKLADDLYQLTKSTNERLNDNLKKANQRIAELKAANGEAAAKKSKIPGFLAADDPMDAIIREVGTISTR